MCGLKILLKFIQSSHVSQNILMTFISDKEWTCKIYQWKQGHVDIIVAIIKPFPLDQYLFFPIEMSWSVSIN